MEASISIIIATASRVKSLRRLLEDLTRLESVEGIDHEVIVANNAPDETLAREIEGVVLDYSRRGNFACWQVRVPLPGKCRAQNSAISETRGSALAFLDDDVEVTPQWLKAVSEFFKNYHYDVMQGPILFSEEMQRSEEFMRIYRRFRTIPFVNYGDRVMEVNTLTGGNMALRREIFPRVGFFDERLGPGRSGISEDVEFAQRILRNGGKIGYEPKARVFHEVDWSRLTEEFFRIRHEQQGRSRLIYKKQSVLSIAPNLMRSIWTYILYSLVGNERKKYRAKGRYFHYLAMLREKMKVFERSLD
jgi:GT2 family glycosyltransferase